MKIIELGKNPASLHHLLNMARSETVILRQSHSVDLVLAPVDEFALEVELLRNNTEFMRYLDELSEEEATIPLEQVERELELGPQD